MTPTPTGLRIEALYPNLGVAIYAADMLPNAPGTCVMVRQP